MTTNLPTRQVSKSTITGWISDILREAGIKNFGPHSLRSAGTSKAKKSIPIDNVLKAGGWSNNSVFAKFYDKPLYTYSGIDQAILQGEK